MLLSKAGISKFLGFVFLNRYICDLYVFIATCTYTILRFLYAENRINSNATVLNDILISVMNIKKSVFVENINKYLGNQSAYHWFFFISTP